MEEYHEVRIRVGRVINWVFFIMSTVSWDVNLGRLWERAERAARAKCIAKSDVVAVI